MLAARWSPAAPLYADFTAAEIRAAKAHFGWTGKNWTHSRARAAWRWLHEQRAKGSVNKHVQRFGLA